MGFFRKNPFFRWSFIRLILGMPRLLKTWQVGDGREEKLAKHVLSTAKRGDPHDVIRVIDRFAWETSFLINVGDEKGKILDDALRSKDPKRVLELGAYCGYSALRMAANAPTAEIVSVEFSSANAGIARRILEHAGVSERVKIVEGHLGDGGQTIQNLKDRYGFGPEAVDFVFVDHDKNVYLPDLKLILREGWLAKGAVVVADNIKFPGAPDYLAYMEEHEGKTWKTKRHETLVEYQSLLKDWVLVSEWLG